MEKLKPCPFCGERDEIRLCQNLDDEYMVECSCCLGCGPVKDNDIDAKYSWNTRTEPEGGDRG